MDKLENKVGGDLEELSQMILRKLSIVSSDKSDNQKDVDINLSAKEIA